MMENPDMERGELRPLLTPGDTIKKDRVINHLLYYDKIRHGYSAALCFILWMALYFTVLALQQSNHRTGALNTAMGQIIRQTSMKLTDASHCAVRSHAQFWHWFGDKLAPTVFHVPWVRKYHDPHNQRVSVKRGYRTMTFNDVGGGIVITQQVRKAGQCRGHSRFFSHWSAATDNCISDNLYTAPRLFVPAMHDSIKWDNTNHGYSLYIPASATPLQLKDVIKFYAHSGFLTRRTAALSVQYTLYNENEDIIGHTTIDFKMSLAGDYQCQAHVESVPTALYATDIQRYRIALEILVVLVWLTQVLNHLRACKEAGGLPFTEASEQMMVREDGALMRTGTASVGRPTGMRVPVTMGVPASVGRPTGKYSLVTECVSVPRDPDTGKPYIFVMAISNILFLTCIVIWVCLNMQYMHLDHALAHQQDGMQAHNNPVHPSLNMTTNTSLLHGTTALNTTTLLNATAMGHLFDSLVAPVDDRNAQINETSRMYFVFSAIHIFFLLLRLLEYFEFQPTLSSTTTTFREILGELVGFALVFGCIVTGFAFMGFLIFGSQIEGFNQFGDALGSTWQLVVGTTLLRNLNNGYVEPDIAYIFTFVFKAFIVLMLLKMVVAIVFESYKVVKRKNLLEYTFVDDIFVMFWHLKHLCQRGYVAPAREGESLFYALLQTEEEYINEQELERILEAAGYTDPANVQWVFREYGEVHGSNPLPPRKEQVACVGTIDQKITGVDDRILTLQEQMIVMATQMNELLAISRNGED